MAKKLGPRYLWFKLSLSTGVVMGMLLLIQSVSSYFHVSRRLVHEQLQREAERQVVFLEREARRLEIWDASQLGRTLDEIRQENPKKVAWSRVLDMAGGTLVQSGDVVGPPFAAQTLRAALDERGPVSEVRGPAGRKVLVVVMPLRVARRPRSESGRAEAIRPPVARPGPRFVEMALYLDSTSTAFGRLQRNLIVSCSAALGLLASMVLLWFRLPHYVRGKQLEQQWELARRVQQDLLPQAGASFHNFDFAAECVSAWQVGGDFYDVFAAEQGRIALVVGDVSGKGLSAALLMSLLHGAVRSSSWLSGTLEHEASSTRLNEILCTRTSPERFASLFWGYYEPEVGILRYLNAGHLPPMLIRRNGSGEFEVQRLEEGGPVLGLIFAAKFRQGEASISSGDLLLLYSDGIVEAENASEEEFGEERLYAVIRNNWARSSVEIRDEILKRVRLFLNEEQPQDDLTLVVIRIQDERATRPERV